MNSGLNRQTFQFQYQYWISIILFFAIVFTSATTHAQSTILPITVSAERLQTPDLSLNEVKELLLNDARIKAVEQAVGFRVESVDAEALAEVNSTTFESYQRLLRVNVNGRIVSEDEPVYEVSGNSVTIHYSSDVQEIKEEPDPYFNVEMTGNKKVFSTGEQLELEVESSKDAYITLFSITEDNKVSVLFPNTYMQENFVEANRIRNIPNHQEKQMIQFTMLPMENKDHYSEMILCIATKDRYSFDQLRSDLTYENDWIELNRWLLELDRSEWTEDYFHYQVFLD